ncbi:glycosyltransferase [Paraconexibacter antarcticus]|uniref:Glycosyltransferase n=1 Tax=Paraconexibacter antarcticus TaxID=2949664 RepID=A0ABY5DQQ7_9ACTN|nr:glycosyltransferase [Paraconexibacter antarcticus]UTI64371.1 glycosyltransferase [Paraconexibacter antarcticus]
MDQTFREEALRWLAAGLLAAVGAYLASVSALVHAHLRHRAPGWVSPLALATCAGVLLAGWRAEPIGAVLVAGLIFAAGCALGRSMLPGFSPTGVVLLSACATMALFAAPWTVLYVAGIPVSHLTRALMLAGVPLILLLLPVAAVQLFEAWEPLCRRTWTRPTSVPTARPGARRPPVCLHVPVHAEPPEVVIGTLNALAALRYEHLDVLVIDNNTDDEQLWRPVEAHCRRLGPRFRFVHVDGLSGAKAGALNLALTLTPAAAEIIGVIDADYHVRADFLEALVPCFEDPSLGFVQTPHDYRQWQHSRYLRMCNFEYAYFFRTILPSRNERTAAITVGTMCLIRRDALERAGGWAEWCVTEDSELAVRIHAAGYRSLYLATSFGQGLIPETFAGYKRQRFRWTYGPVQELRRHWRLFLPRPLATPSQLTPAQKIHHLNHGLDRVAMGLRVLLLPLGVAIAASMTLHHERIPVPFELWATVTAGTATSLLLRWLTFRVLVGCSLIDTIGAFLASKALEYTVTTASIWGLLTHSIPWRRTDKFPTLPKGLRALSACIPELLLALLALAIPALIAIAGAPSGLLLMLLIGAGLQSAVYLTAPLLALLADHDRRADHPNGPRSTGPLATLRPDLAHDT